MNTWYEGEQMIRDYFSPHPRMARFAVGPESRLGRPRLPRHRAASTTR